MPGLFSRYINRSQELAAEREKLRQKKIASWEHMKQQIAKKYE